jgi:hypothetical protein
MSLSDLIGGIIGFSLTLLVFSYLLGDNPLFRVAIFIFIGVASGYAGIVAINSVLLPRLVAPLLSNNRGEQILALVPLFLSWLLLTKISPRLASWGNVPMAYLVGVGAAAAIGGAVTGTLFPQANASINLFDLQIAQERSANVGFYLLNGSIILAGTLTTLAYFHFGARPQPNQPPIRQAWINEISQVGQFFIAVTFGVIFAGAYSAALVALIERLNFLVNFLKPLLEPFITS